MMVNCTFLQKKSGQKVIRSGSCVKKSDICESMKRPKKEKEKLDFRGGSNIYQAYVITHSGQRDKAQIGRT